MFNFLLLLVLFSGCSTGGYTLKPNKQRSLSGKSIIFTYNGSLSWASELAAVSNCTVNLEEFQNELSLVEKFDHSSDSGKQVLERLLSSSKEIATYKTKNPWSKTIATTYYTDEHKLYLNTRKNPRSMSKMVNTACHEKLHLNGYSHGSNSPVGKENTVNYFVGSLCEKHSKACL